LEDTITWQKYEVILKLAQLKAGSWELGVGAGSLEARSISYI
jgi:hypothetical protein